MIDISKVKPDDLRKGLFEDNFPLLYNLRGYRENNAWHKNQDIFEHVIGVFTALRETLSCYQNNPKLADRLNAKIDSLTISDLLLFLGIYHDCAKPYTLITKPNLSTECPAHDEIGALLALDLPEFSLKEKEALSFLISKHGFVNAVSLIYEANNDPKILDFFKKASKGYEIELILFMMADLEGSDLSSISQKTYLKRKETLGSILNYFS